MPFVCIRKRNETWKQAVVRYSKKAGDGMEDETLDIFFADIKRGLEPQEAAWDALHEFGLLDYVDGNSSLPPQEDITD